jgi:hypothetical protein
MANSWFCYDGTGDVCDPLNYTVCPIPNCPPPKQRICAIFAPVQIIGGVQRPIISPELCMEILTSECTLFESANVRLKP